MSDERQHWRVVRYVAIEGATLAEFVAKLNSAHEQIINEGREYAVRQTVAAPITSAAWWTILTVVEREQLAGNRKGGSASE